MGDKIRIVHCVKAVAVGGGVARMDSYYHRHLPPHRFQLTFLVLDDPDPTAVPYDPTMRFIHTGRGDRFAGAVAAFREADIVQYSDGFQPLVCEAAQVAGVPVLVEIHHDIEAGGLYDTIDRIVCVSAASAAVQPDREKCSVIYNGIEPEAFPYCERAKGERFTILQVGSRGKATVNLDELADELLALDPRIELVIAGFDQTLPSRERVTFLGVRADVVALYKNADLFFLHSIREAFGLVVIEAMGTGLVPLVSSYGGPVEIVEDGVTGFVTPHEDRAGMVAGVEEALAAWDEGRLADMGRAARAVVEERFDIREKMGEYARLYEDLMASERDRPPVESDATPSPEVWLDDALFHFDAGRWDEAAKAAHKAFAHPAPIRVPMCGWLTRQIARQAEAKGDASLAHAACAKLFASGFRDVDWMKRWLTFAPVEFDIGPVVDALLPLAPTDPEVIMSAVEDALVKQDLPRALALLEEGVKNVPWYADLADMRDALREKMAP